MDEVDLTTTEKSRESNIKVYHRPEYLLDFLYCNGDFFISDGVLKWLMRFQENQCFDTFAFYLLLKENNV